MIRSNTAPTSHTLFARKVWVLTFCLLSVLAGAWALSAPQDAAADIGPGPGLKRVKVSHALDKIEGFEEYAFFLVSTNGRESWVLDVRPVSRDGEDLKVPSGYMDHSVLVALTQAQLAELARLALPLFQFQADREKLSAMDDLALAAHFAALSWGTIPADMEAFKQKARTEVPLMAFFMRDDVATTHTLSFRAEISSSSSAQALAKRWKIASINDGEVRLNATEDKALDEKGNWIVTPPGGGSNSGDDGSLGLWLGLGMLAAGVMLFVVIQMRSPRRAQVAA